jgi:hypothetical protein
VGVAMVQGVGVVMRSGPKRAVIIQTAVATPGNARGTAQLSASGSDREGLHFTACVGRTMLQTTPKGTRQNGVDARWGELSSHSTRGMTWEPMAARDSEATRATCGGLNKRQS